MTRICFVSEWGRDHWLVTDDDERRYIVCIADLAAGLDGLRAARGRLLEVSR